MCQSVRLRAASFRSLTPPWGDIIILSGLHLKLILSFGGYSDGAQHLHFLHLSRIPATYNSWTITNDTSRTKSDCRSPYGVNGIYTLLEHLLYVGSLWMMKQSKCRFRVITHTIRFFIYYHTQMIIMAVTVWFAFWRHWNSSPCTGTPG
jgi:hypothetical protein